MTKQEIEKYAEEKAQEFKEQIIKELSEKIEEQYNKPYLIKKGEKYWAIHDNNYVYRTNHGEDLDVSFYLTGLVARTERELEDLLIARKMQREYELWCMQYPCDWEDYEQEKYCIYYYGKTKKSEVGIGRSYFGKEQGTIYCSNATHLQAFIDKVGEENFVKYVLEIGLKKYWLEV